MPPSYHNWAPWIGPHTRQSTVVLNTEHDKLQAPKMTTDVDDQMSSDGDDMQVTEERLADELLNLKVSLKKVK